MSDPAAVNLFTLDAVTATALCAALAHASAPSPWTARPELLRIESEPTAAKPQRRAWGLLGSSPTGFTASTRPCAVVGADHTLWLERATQARARAIYLRPALFQLADTIDALTGPLGASRAAMARLVALDRRLARCEQIPLEHFYGPDDPAARDSLARVGLDAAQVARALASGGRDPGALYLEALRSTLARVSDETAPRADAMAELIARVAPAAVVALIGPSGVDSEIVRAAAHAAGYRGEIRTPPIGGLHATLAERDPSGDQVLLTLVMHPSRLEEAPRPGPARPLGVSLTDDEDVPYRLLVAAAETGVAVEISDAFVAFFAPSDLAAAG